MKSLFILVSTIFLTTCASNQYEDYTPAVVISSVEYDGEPYMLGCKGNFKCEKSTLSCIYHYHKLAQNHIDKVKKLIELNKEDVPVITQLYNALCSLYEAEVYLSVLKKENKQDWGMLEKSGFVRQVSMVISILIIKIRQMEDASY